MTERKSGGIKESDENECDGSRLGSGQGAWLVKCDGACLRHSVGIAVPTRHCRQSGHIIVYNQLTLQEVVVETSGAGADRDSGALLMNVISKDGGNRFSGSAMFGFAHGSPENSNWNEELGSRLKEVPAESLKKYMDLTIRPVEAKRRWKLTGEGTLSGLFQRAVFPKRDSSAP